MNIIAFIIFFVWRFRKESGYIKDLEENVDYENTFDMLLAALPRGKSSFEKKITYTIDELISVAREELNQLKVEHLEENDHILSWIHEVKTPLTSMKLLIDTIENGQMQKKLEFEWLRIHLLLDQQLHHTRLPSMEKDYMIGPVNIQRIVHLEIKELQAWCMQKEIGFEINLLHVEVLTDQKWLSFIIRQILSNAVKYSNENCDIHIFSQKDEMGHTLLHIHDCGIGVTQADLPRIFEKSFTGTIGREKASSTGMGLYLAKNAADKLGIEIFVDSKVNIGSTFSIKFPLKNEMTKIVGR
ncbi:sensor histidine kinase [Psychrobacillus sp. L3]|uniref:sensor histidine kinase n=1 Tax=Psychrobacillus sp. L3 TaxID=3236891 RepID=UPI0036F22BC8